MLRLLTRGSRMRSLYLEYLKHCSTAGEESSTAADILAAIRSMVVGQDGDDEPARPAWLVRRRFERFRHTHRHLGDTDPSAA